MPLVDTPLFNAFDQPPADVPPGQPVPLLVVLHGAGEFGGDTEPQVKRHGPWSDVVSLQPAGYHADAVAAFSRFRILGLHGPAQDDWQGDQTSAAIEAYRGLHPEIDPARICLTGMSRGGRGVLRTVIHRRTNNLPVHSVAVFCPERADPAYSQQQIALLQNVPIYFFHSPGDQGQFHAYDDTQALQNGIGNQSSCLRPIQANELRWPSSPHVCWTCVYGHPALYDWLIDPPSDPSAWPNMILPYAPAAQA